MIMYTNKQLVSVLSWKTRKIGELILLALPLDAHQVFVLFDSLLIIELCPAHTIHLRSYLLQKHLVCCEVSSLPGPGAARVEGAAPGIAAIESPGLVGEMSCFLG